MSYVVGLMSGTSLDGCDAALVEIDDGIRLIAFLTLPMPDKLCSEILDCYSDVRQCSAA